jgi:4-hydroxy-tetrahydrodipicolinate synthase
VPIIAGAGSNSTAEAIELVAHAKAVGADAALVVTPYYNRPSQEGLFRHYSAINDAVQLPIIVYNVPSRTSGDISNETLARLAVLPNIVGIKDATSDMTRVSFQRLMCGPEWVMLSGDDPTALGYIAHGGHGCISVTANVAPAACAAFYNACLKGDFEAARAGQDRLVRLHKALFLDSSPSPTKFALAHLGLCSDEVRLPIAPCADAVKPSILEAMREAGVIA